GNSAVPVPVAGSYHFTSLSAGSSYTCGMTIETGWVCWGLISTVGNTTTVSTTPTHVASLDGLTEYTPGSSMGGAVRGGRALMVFGVNDLSDASAPLPIYAVRASDTNACGLAADGEVFCWGWNDAGQLGNPHMYGYEPNFNSAQIVVAPSASSQLGAPSPRPPAR
ncbi:MAG: RCC1 domain-containing protein, partial [Gemmatimonadales bacterium]